MSDIAIRVENLSKRYHIGRARQRHDTLRDALMDGLQAPLRRLRRNGAHEEENAIWALQDVSFEVKRGEVVGVIGRNGAGKSTLLKILTQITEPTTGRAILNGRVGSLLEVGTGFHPELTGKENIYLSGALLGMHRAEIDRKFDEIVEFSGVEKFIDTPVKRYSSGMNVRLGFAVAAHLEPEILLIDEVLAVGDSEFQKKCLGKIGDVASQGRTVLFVSHDMRAIQRLCPETLLLREGRLVARASSVEIVNQYLSGGGLDAPDVWVDLTGASRLGTGAARFSAIKYSSLEESVANRAYTGGSLDFYLSVTSNMDRRVDNLAVVISDQHGNRLVNIDALDLGQSFTLTEGENEIHFRIDRLYLNPGLYPVSLWLAEPGQKLDHVPTALTLEIVEANGTELGMTPQYRGYVPCYFELAITNALGHQAIDSNHVSAIQPLAWQRVE